MTGVLDVLGLVVSALDRARVRYTIGGSLASSFAGEPRASLDADIVVEMNRDQVGPFVTALGTAFHCDEEALQRAVSRGSSTNVIHQASGIKVDLFVASSAPTRRRVSISPASSSARNERSPVNQTCHDRTRRSKAAS